MEISFTHREECSRSRGIVEKVVVFGVIPTALKPRLKARLSSAFSAQVFGVWTHGQPPSYLFTIVSPLWTDREIWGVIIARYTPTGGKGEGVETPSMSLIFFPFLPSDFLSLLLSLKLYTRVGVRQLMRLTTSFQRICVIEVRPSTWLINRARNFLLRSLLAPFFFSSSSSINNLYWPPRVIRGGEE